MNEILHTSFPDGHTSMMAVGPNTTNTRNFERRPSLIVRQNLAADVGRNLYDSMSYSTSLIAVSILKIITSASVLLFVNNRCNKPIDDFLIYMIIHDFLYCVVLLLKLLVALSVYDNEDLLQERDIEARPQAFNQHALNNSTRSISVPGENNVYYSMDNDRLTAFERKTKLLSGISILVNIYYYVVFFYGQYLYFQSDSDCSTAASALNGIVFLYICFGYIYIGIPIVFLLMAYLCMPFVLLFIYLFSKKEQVPASKNIIKNLPVTEYKSGMPGNPECSICMVDYQEKDKIIQLKCSPLHYYHEDCLKKWLGVNGLCPICRKRIGQEETELKERHSPQEE